ncbi:MOSC domain-containing protein [Pseudooceanicola algae]|uniref:Metal-sulfur cluster biosynthesis proteins YuaD n=1 Tax=Pseudooceanicola algae TaxID=1537215 RepID=A0A418SI64_9RHOB|nr:MOSC domain-containing protein [Pseudooceanicola algae]QPM88937.1 Putative metal-sulfur cluster biosynthesis proteins YuaD [Pseudooceanicola algae]
MPALVKTDYIARVTWLGMVADREAALASGAVPRITAGFDGPRGEDHGGLTRPSCSRVLNQYPKRGTEIRNVRQFSILSAEELARIAATMGLDSLDPAFLGATLVLEGIPDFTHLPPSSRLQGPDGVTLTVDMENLPCTLPARVIEDALPGYGKTFKPAAEGRRGVTAWVEKEGEIALGDQMRLFIPAQRPWDPI